MGIKDQGLSECLQLDPSLTFEKAKTLTQQQEAIHKQQVIPTSSSSQLSPSPVMQLNIKAEILVPQTKAKTAPDVGEFITVKHVTSQGCNIS